MQHNARRESELWVSEHPDGLVFLAPRSGQMFTANKVGAQVWSGLSEGLRLEVIAEDIAQSLHIELERAMRDVVAFNNDLRRNGLLEGRELQ